MTQLVPQTPRVNINAIVNAQEAAWRAAVAALNNGASASSCVQTVFNILPPPATARTVATIVGAIYADSFWNGSMLVPQLLADQLTLSGLWDRPTALDAAQQALRNWRGMFLRNSFDDTGAIPKTSDWSKSPDSLCNQAGELDPATIISRWNSFFFDEAVTGKNFCYTRAQSMNFPIEIPGVSATMYFVEPFLNPPPAPGSWVQMPAIGGGLTSPMVDATGITRPVPAGGRVASSPGFSFQPPQAQHYCLIALVSTPYFTNAVPSQFQNWSQSQWITFNGAAGWHNIEVINGKFERRVKFHNYDATAERFLVRAQLTNGTPGTRVSLGSAHPALAQTFRSSAEVAGPAHQQEIEGILPANLDDELIVSVDRPLPEDAVLAINLHWIVDTDHPRYDEAVELYHAPAGKRIELKCGDYYYLGSKEQ